MSSKTLDEYKKAYSDYNYICIDEYTYKYIVVPTDIYGPAFSVLNENGFASWNVLLG